MDKEAAALYTKPSLDKTVGTFISRHCQPFPIPHEVAMTVVTPKFRMGASVRRVEDMKHIDMPATPSRIWGAIQDASMQ